MPQKIENYKYQTIVTEYVRRIIDGTDAEADEILRELPGYQPIPEINMMTLPMMHRLCYIPAGDNHLYNTITNRKLNRFAAKGRWGSGQESYGDIISISWHMKRAGMDITPSEGMKFIGSRIGNNIMNLYPPRVVLATLYASLRARYLVAKQVESHYVLVQPPAEAPQTLPEPAQTTQAIFTPEFVAQLVQVCVRESVAAALASRAAVENIHRAG